MTLSFPHFYFPTVYVLQTKNCGQEDSLCRSYLLSTSILQEKNDRHLYIPNHIRKVSCTHFLDLHLFVRRKHELNKNFWCHLFFSVTCKILAREWRERVTSFLASPRTVWIIQYLLNVMYRLYVLNKKFATKTNILNLCCQSRIFLLSNNNFPII
jgi:hypothetical protein